MRQALSGWVPSLLTVGFGMGLVKNNKMLIFTVIDIFSRLISSKMYAFHAAVYVAVAVVFSSRCCCEGVDSKCSLTLVQACYI